MTDLNEMTPDEANRVQNAIQGRQPVRLLRVSDDQIVPVPAAKVAERLASGEYKPIEEQQ